MSDTTTRLGLVCHGGRPEAVQAALTVAERLQVLGAVAVGVEGDSWTSPSAEFREPDAFAKGLDVIIALGGDGTFLRAAYLARDCGVPVAGVNLGRLGFLSEIEATQLGDAVERLCAGDFAVEERMTLSVAVYDAEDQLVGTSWALNDASVERTIPNRLIVLQAAVNGTVLTNVPADALICATPTGSTAYAFSAGGPILSPLIDAILLTPVAPHSLFNRTIVIDSNESLTVRQVGGENGCVVSCDGRESIVVPDGGTVRVTRGDAPVRLARLAEFDFYRRVRDKFGLR